MTNGKNISVYLMDGTSNGPIKCSMMNWNGLAFKIPRTDLNKFKDRKELKQSGVYFLFGSSDGDEKSVVYVGQAGARKNGEAILNRLFEHNRNPEKDYWTEAVVFTTKDGFFGPTEISYLEHSFCNLAKKVGRYEVKNSADPSSGGNMTEEKESEMLEYMENAELILGVLGYKLLTPLTTSMSSSSINSSSDAASDVELFISRYIKKFNKTAKGRAVMTAEGFVVLRGSVLAPEVTKSVSGYVALKRQQTRIENNVLQEDVLFSNPSSAASFVVGNAANGWTEWKNKAGVSLEKLLDRSVPESTKTKSQDQLQSEIRYASSDDILKLFPDNDKLVSDDEIDGDEEEKVNEVFVYLGRMNMKLNMFMQATGRYNYETKHLIVFSGSTVSPDVNDRVRTRVESERQRTQIRNNVLQENLDFSNPTRAAEFIIGNTANGLAEWKDKDGISLGKLIKQKD